MAGFTCDICGGAIKMQASLSSAYWRKNCKAKQNAMKSMRRSLVVRTKKCMARQQKCRSC